MNTDALTSNTQATLAYQQAAEDIMDVFEKLGFTSDVQNDPAAVKNEIVNAIRARVEGNVTYAQATG